MKNDSLTRSLEAHQAYYQHVFAQLFPEAVIQQQKQQTLRQFYAQLSELEAIVAGLENEFGYKYNPNQPRVPAGNPDGGQWTSGGVSADDEDMPYDPPIEPVYPVEEALGMLTGAQALFSIRAALLSARGAVIQAETAVVRAAKSIEKYLGGQGKIISNKAGDTVIMRGSKKIRFDIKNPGRVSVRNQNYDKPHFHIEEEISPDNWVDAGSKHKYYFKE